MSALTFGWTTPALLAGAKTSLRQHWGPRTAAQFHRGQIVEAYARDPRRGGRPVARLRLTAEPTYEPLAAMGDADYQSEGWQWLYDHPECLGPGMTRNDFGPEAFGQWRSRPFSTWVVRFEVLPVAEALGPGPVAVGA